MAKDFLAENNIEYEEKNLANREYMQELMKMGHRGVPVIVIGDEQIVGFDKDKITNALGL